LGSEQNQAQPLAPGFLVVHANQPEQLRALIVQWLRAYPLDVFETETVLVQSNGIAQWLKLALAADVNHGDLLQGGLGIASGLSLQMPGRFIWQLYRLVMPDAQIPKTSVFDKDRLRWRLLRLLPELGKRDAFKAIAEYLQQDVDHKKADQLALKLADLFDQYQVYRADWLQDWAAGRIVLRDANGALQTMPPEQHWQALLWQAVLEDLAGAGAQFSRAQLHQDFLKQAATYTLEHRPPQLPRRVILFGISSLPQQSLEALAAIAPYTQILLAVHNPCQHYWADIIADKDLFRAQQQRQPHKLSLAAISNNDSHPLLAAWGKQGRDYIRLLDQFDQTSAHKALFVGERIDLFTAPDTNSLLGQLQHDIFDLTAGTQGQWPKVTAADKSLCFVKAHSVLREIEILHDDILQQLATNPALNFSDFMVMVPDINDYAAAIHAVFGRISRDDSRYIPYTIADQAALQQEPLLQALQYLLHIRQQRFGISEILDLLQVPAVAARFGFDDVAIQTLTGWLNQANVRWGLHAEQRESLGIGVHFENHSLFAGLSRMLAGYALGDAAPWLDVVPLRDVSGLSAEIAGQFAMVCQQLESCWLDSAEPNTPEQWQQLLLSWLQQWFVASNEQEVGLLQRLRETLAEWLNCCRDGNFAEPVALSVVAAAWLDGFNQQSLQQKFLAGAVNFATLMPMRAIPFAQIHLLGMQDGAFPRQSRRQDFDLMTHSYRPGDRARRDDDRYLFLEALLSARQRLSISWIGHSIHDNSEREPSVLVAQLRDHLQQVWRHQDHDDLLAAITVTHPLQAFSKRYLQDETLLSYQHEWRSLHQPQKTSIGIPSDTADASSAGVTELSSAAAVGEVAIRHWDLMQLTDFMREPVKFFFRQRLKVNLQLQTETSPDAEDFHHDRLSQWQIQQQLGEGVTRVLRDGGDAHAYLQQALHLMQLEDRLAFGAAGTLQAEAFINSINPQLALYRDALAQTNPIAAESLCFLEFADIADWFSELRQDSKGQALQLQWSLAPLKKDKMWQLKPLLKPWLAQQLSCAAGRPIAQWLVAADGLLQLPVVTAQIAQQRLSQILQLAISASAGPLPLEISLAGLWLQLAVDEEKKLQKLQTRFEGDGFNPGLLDYDVYLARAFTNFASLWQQARARELPKEFYQAVIDDVNNGVFLDANA
jgi:exodeoxyribonuclease V gamma subunit